MLRLLLAGLFAAALCLAQMRLTVAQLRAFVESSKQLGHSDKKVAEYLRNVRLTQRLEERTVVELQAAGAGPKTVEVLRDMVAVSKDLPGAPAPAAKAAPRPIPPPDSMEQARVLDEARQYALDYVKRLPNFICTQVTRRYVDPSGLEFWHLEDTVVAKLSYDGEREDYKVVLVNNRMMDTTMERIGGATSTGEFGSMLKDIFSAESQARFQWERWGTLRGRRMHVYSYVVPQANSKWHVIFEKSMEIVPGYKGLVYVDKEGGAIMRVTLDAIDIPTSFPIQQAMTTLDYDVAEIAGSPYILPLKAQVRMRAGRFLTRNDVEFRFYKRFGAEATIVVTDPLPDDKEQPAQPNK